MKDIARLLILTYFMSLFSFNANYAVAENFVCGVDGAEYSDTIESTSACLKLDNNENFCPVGALSCTQSSTTGLNQTQCSKIGGVWNTGQSKTVTKTAYVKEATRDQTIVSLIETGAASYGVHKVSKGVISRIHNVSLASTAGSYHYASQMVSTGGRDDRETWTVDFFFPSYYASWMPLSNGANARYRAHTMKELNWGINVETKGWRSAKNYFSLDSQGLPANSGVSGYSLTSTSYYIKSQSLTRGNDGIYLKGVWVANEPSYCTMPDGSTSYWSAPGGGSGVCTNVNGTYLSEVNTCVDLDDIEDVSEEYEVSGEMLVDDGARDGEGNCIDTMMLFVGRGQACKKPGVSSAWQNCCSYDGEITNENTGSMSQVAATTEVIVGIYDISKAAYVAYSTAAASGATASAAATAAGAAAGEAATVAFDPTTMAIAATVYLVTQWMAKACGQSDMETAAANASGHCIEVGSYCTKKYKFIGCVQQSRSFCCFNGKMQKIFHEQGRPQLTTFADGFGTPTAPNCRGFTPAEFQSLDFSKIDLTEYYSDLNFSASETIQSDMEDKVNDYMEFTD